MLDVDHSSDVHYLIDLDVGCRSNNNTNREDVYY